jgi:hypothetical protein
MPSIVYGSAEPGAIHPHADVRRYVDADGTIYIGVDTFDAETVCDANCAAEYLSAHGWALLQAASHYGARLSAIDAAVDGRINTADVHDETIDPFSPCANCGADLSPTIYAVEGPSAEWADGMGILYYSNNRNDAEAYILDLITDEEEYGPRSWRTAHEADVIPLSLCYLAQTDREIIDAYYDGGIDGVVEYLNASLTY